MLEGALEKAVDAARNIHIKYAISNVTRMILDDIEDAVLAVDESGRLLAANRRARQLYQLPRRGRVPVQSVSEIHPKLTYIGNPENPLRDGDEHLLTLQGQRYLVRYRLITGSSGTTGTLIVTASASKPLQDRRQLRGSLVRQGLTSKYTFDDIIAVSQAMQGKIQIAKKILHGKFQRPHHRRDRHWQGAFRSQHPCRQPPGGPAFCGGKLRRPP